MHLHRSFRARLAGRGKNQLSLLVLALFCSTAFAAAVSIAAPAQEEGTGSKIITAMETLLDGLRPALVRHSATALEDPERYRWNYQVAGRVGLPMFELDTTERERLWALLESALGSQGAGQARDIIALERYVFETTEDASRDPDWYFLTLFEMPRTQGAWAWRFEGHHISVNFTLLDGEVVGTTPLFFGTEPLRRQGTSSRAEVQPLARQAAAGRALLESLDPDQRRRAVFAAEPPDDIITQTDRRAMRPSLLGIRYAELTSEQQALMRALIESYADRLQPSLAASEFAAIEQAGLDEVRLGWAGPVTPGAAHYYRVHGRNFLIEYGHVDGDPEHVHSVWRKFDDDFARRTLRDFAASNPAIVNTTPSPPSPTPDPQRPDSPPAPTLPAAPVRTLELIAAAVEANGCYATATVVSRRRLAASDKLPRNIMPSPDLEILTLRIEASESREGLENLCQQGDEIDALSPRHPDGSLLGKTIGVTLELVGDARVSVWRATRIRTNEPTP
jgi:hypothetical protein